MLRMASVIVVMAVWSGHAMAWTGTVIWPDYYRAGPGNQYGVLDEVERGQTFDVLSCDGDWCKVRDSSSVGYLERGVIAALPTQPPPPVKTGDCFTSRSDPEPGEPEMFRYCEQTGG